MNHARKTTIYTPDGEDWLWYAALPLLAYLSLSIAGILVWRYIELSFVITAATTLLFLFLGIHNAWDTVTYIVVLHRERTKQTQEVAKH